MKIAIGSDKSGFSLKEHIKTHLKKKGITCEDVGSQDVENALPFFRVAPNVAREIAERRADFGILICGTGMGMAQVANKFKGVRAACVESTYCAKMSRAVNDSNVLCLGGWVIAPELGVSMVDAFLQTSHTEGLEPWRQENLRKALHEVTLIEDRIYSK